MPESARVLSQHAEEAPFLWGLRNRAVAAPHYSLADLAKLDQRVEAHLDGLRIAGEEGWQLCRKELAWKEPGEVFAAAVLALESANKERIAEVVKIGTAEAALARGLISAMGWLSFAQIENHAKRFISADSPRSRHVGIAVFAVHREDPGELLRNALRSEDSLLKARALRAVGELGRMDLVSLSQNDLNAKDEACRFWAAWSTALLVGYTNAVQILQSFAESASPYHEKALQMALRRSRIDSAHSWQKRLAANPKSARLAVVGAGVIGDPVLVTWLIEQMKVPPLARVAGEAFTMITGVDIAYEDLDGDQPEGFESGPTEDPKDENVELDPDEKLPWPGAGLIARWWEEHNREFQDGVRYLLGKPITMEWMNQVLRTGRQRQRTAAALELAIMLPGKPMFEVRAPGFRQQELLR